MKNMLRRGWPLFALAGLNHSPAVGIAQTIFSENAGTPSGTTTFAANSWQNSSLTFTGTGDVRNTTASTGYSGASGGGNVFLTNTVGRDFQIAGINTLNRSGFGLAFGAFKSTTASNMTELSVEVSSNGTSYSPLSFPAQPTGSGTANWRLITTTSPSIPAGANIRLRWTNTSATPQFRLDDFILTGTLRSAPATLVWNGAVNTVWNEANWTGNNAPLNGDSLEFAGTTGLSNGNNITGLALNAIGFPSGAGAYTLAGNAFSLSGGVTNSSFNTQTINPNLTLTASQTFDASTAALAFGGTVANGGFQLTLAGPNNTTITGAVSGTGGLNKAGTGALTLSGANAFTGQTWLQGGSIIVDAAATLSGGTAGLKMGDDTLANNVTLTLNNSFQDIGTLSQGSAGGTKTIELNNSTELRITQTVAGAFDGSITGANGVLNLAAAGTAPLTLSGANTYTGPTFVNGGTLFINGSLSAGGGPVAVASGATLGGSGTINRAVTSNGTLAPGTGIGTLNIVSTATINNVLEIEATATPTVDLLNVSGALSLPLGSTIRVIGALNGTSTYTVATYTGSLSSLATLTGTAANIGLYSLDYSTPGQINLVPVPEPATLLGLAALGLVGVRLRRRAV